LLQALRILLLREQTHTSGQAKLSERQL
jgi:hypothetical protein